MPSIASLRAVRNRSSTRPKSPVAQRRALDGAPVEKRGDRIGEGVIVVTGDHVTGTGYVDDRCVRNQGFYYCRPQTCAEIVDTITRETSRPITPAE
jgi:hypothetical protein